MRDISPSKIITLPLKSRFEKIDDKINIEYCFTINNETNYIKAQENLFLTSKFFEYIKNGDNIRGGLLLCGDGNLDVIYSIKSFESRYKDFKNKSLDYKIDNDTKQVLEDRTIYQIVINEAENYNLPLQLLEFKNQQKCFVLAY